MSTPSPLLPPPLPPAPPATLITTLRAAALALPPGDGTNLTRHQQLILMHLRGWERHLRASEVYTNFGVLRARFASLHFATAAEMAAAGLRMEQVPRRSVDRPSWTREYRKKEEGEKKKGVWVSRRKRRSKGGLEKGDHAALLGLQSRVRHT